MAKKAAPKTDVIYVRVKRLKTCIIKIPKARNPEDAERQAIEKEGVVTILGSSYYKEGF